MTAPISLLTGPATLELTMIFRDAGYLPDLEKHLRHCATCGQMVMVDGAPRVQWCEEGAPLIAYARELAQKEREQEEAHRAALALLAPNAADAEPP